VADEGGDGERDAEDDGPGQRQRVGTAGGKAQRDE
jgi:hypothetical protein